MGTSKAAGPRLDYALRRVPEVPAHARAAELSADAAAWRLQNRPLRNRPLCSTSLRGPDGDHGRPPRPLTRWQARPGRRLGQRQR
jgi:hypothetical protein